MTEDKITDGDRPAEEEAGKPAEENSPESGHSADTDPAPPEESAESALTRQTEEAVAQENMQMESSDEVSEADPDEAEEIETIEDFDLNLLLDIPLEITVELGRNRVRIQKLLELEPGSTVTLSKLEGEPVDILANDKLIARGEVVLQNKKYGIRITEITSRMNRIQSLH
ncbi:MAG: flagellar motor switch protein FliN [Desulfobacterales bacterium]|nr:flagellar motor switch protein FliN [Desulfobacterales bacterium]